MSTIFGSLNILIALVFAGGAVILSVFGLVDALRHRPDAFTAAGMFLVMLARGWVRLFEIATAKNP